MLHATSFVVTESVLFKFIVLLLIIKAFGVHYAIGIVFYDE